MYRNVNLYPNSQIYNNQDERFFGGFLGPFILGGITGGLLFIGMDAIRSKIRMLKNDTVIDILVILLLLLIIMYSFNINIFGMIWG